MSLLMLAPNLAGQFCLVLVALAVAFIVRFWGRRPLAILGLRRPHASSFAWAAAHIAVDLVGIVINAPS
jgi:hypothetical protein